MMKTTLIGLAAASMVALAANAQDAKEASGSLAERLERIEKAIARLEAKVSGGGGDSIMEGCRDMMGGGMMGRGGMMDGAPNSRWKSPDGPR